MDLYKIMFLDAIGNGLPFSSFSRKPLEAIAIDEQESKLPASSGFSFASLVLT